MSIKDLVKKLQAQPNQEHQVEYLVYGKKEGELVTVEMSGKDTTKIIRILGKRKKPAPRP